VDGVARAEDARQVSIHLSTCESCRRLTEAQRSVRMVLRARSAEIAPIAPPGLRTRIAALADESSRVRQAALGWPGRLSAFSAAVVVVLIVGAVLLPIVTARSTVLLAAQLALDHLKCFVIDGDAANTPITPAQAETTIQTLYGRTLRVPEAVASEGMKLVAVRQCLYGDGQAAHLLYRMNGEPVSLFIMPGLVQPGADLEVLGHSQIIWSSSGKTYVLLAKTGQIERLHRVASRFQIEAQ
jgi:anti-sigma factor RsiW